MVVWDSLAVTRLSWALLDVFRWRLSDWPGFSPWTSVMVFESSLNKSLGASLEPRVDAVTAKWSQAYYVGGGKTILRNRTSIFSSHVKRSHVSLLFYFRFLNISMRGDQHGVLLSLLSFEQQLFGVVVIMIRLLLFPFLYFIPCWDCVCDVGFQQNFGFRWLCLGGSTKHWLCWRSIHFFNLGVSPA